MPKNSKLGPIKFPIDTHQQLGSKISFQAIEVKPPEIDIKLEKSETHKDISSSSGGGGPLPGVPPGVEDPGLQGTFGNIGDKIGNFFKGAGQGSMGAGQKINLLRGEKIDLYLPVAYQVNDALQYDHAQLGTIGAGVAGALQSGGGVVQGTMESINEGFSSIGDFFKSGAFSGVASRVGAAMIGEKMGGKIGAALGISARVAINPNLRTKFNGVSIREFTFQFKLIPKSPRESVAIKDLIKFFRFHAYPEEIPSGRAFSIALDYPNLFKIRLLSNVGGRFKNIGTPIKYCYLRTISTVYNPTTPVLHPDGSPTEVDLNLSFTEYKPLSRYDIMIEDKNSLYDVEKPLTKGDIDQVTQSLPTQGPDLPVPIPTNTNSFPQ